MKKILLLFAAAFVSFAAYAEIHTTSVEVHAFNSLQVSKNFDLTVENGDSYKLELHVDSRVMDYVNFYVQAGTLYITVEEKSFPKELASQLKKKGENAVVRANVTVPKNHLSNIILNNTTVLNVKGTLVPGNNFSLTLNDNTSVKTLRVEGKQVNLFVNKKSNLKASINCSNIIVKSANNSVSSIDIKGEEADITTEGNSQLNFTGEVDICVLNSSNSSKTEFKGKANKLNLTGSNFANVNASAFETKEVSVNLSNCTASVNPLEKLDIILSNGAKLTYGNKPAISIQRINSSSVFRASDTKK